MAKSTVLLERSLISSRLLRSRCQSLRLSRGIVQVQERSHSNVFTRTEQAPHLRSRLSGALCCTFNPPAGIVKSDFIVDIPEISLGDFVLNRFKEYGDDTAMVNGYYFFFLSRVIIVWYTITSTLKFVCNRSWIVLSVVFFYGPPGMNLSEQYVR